MDERDLDVFVQGVLEYFRSVLEVNAEIDTPYLENTQKGNVLFDYTGIIGISGNFRGAIYITCQREILIEIVSRLLGVENPDDMAIRDMVGEIANTIAGNASKVFGNAFQISVPLIMNGTPNYLSLPIEIPAYVIPFKVQGKKAALVVGFKKYE